MTLPILAQTAKEADPRRNYRMRDFLETLGLRPVFIPDPGPEAAEPVQDAPAAEAGAPAGLEAGDAPPAPDEGPHCEAQGPGLFSCTASPGHGGPDHIAYGSDGEVCDRWPQQPVGPAAPAPELEPYALNSISVPAKDEPAEADAEAGQ